MSNRQQDNFLVRFFDGLNLTIREAEASLVNFISATAPWAAPMIPAYLTFIHTQQYLGFPFWIALLTSFVVESLGLSTVSTAMGFWAHNKKYSADKNKAPLAIPVISFVYYLFVITFVNVLLESSDITWVLIASKALLTSLSIPAAVTLAVRTQHIELLKDIGKRYSAPKQPSKPAPKVVEEPPKIIDKRAFVERAYNKFIEQYNREPKQRELHRYIKERVSLGTINNFYKEL